MSSAGLLAGGGVAGKATPGQAGRGRRIAIALVLLLIVLGASLGTAWLGFGVVRFPRVERALGLTVGVNATPVPAPSLILESPTNGMTVVEGADAFEGIASRAAQVAMWVKGVNVPMYVPTSSDGSWIIQTEERMLPRGETTLVFASVTARGEWGVPKEVDVFVQGAEEEEVLPTSEPATEPSFFRRYVLQPLFSIFQPIGAIAPAPVSVLITQTDTNQDRIPDGVQSGPVEPTSALSVPYGYAWIIGVVIAAIVLVLFVFQPRVLREHIAFKRRLNAKRLESAMSLRERKLANRFALTKREQQVDAAKALEGLRGQRAVAVAREMAKGVGERAKALMALGAVEARRLGLLEQKLAKERVLEIARVRREGALQAQKMQVQRDLRIARVQAKAGTQNEKTRAAAALAAKERDLGRELKALEVEAKKADERRARFEAQKAAFESQKVEINIRGGRARRKRRRGA